MKILKVILATCLTAFILMGSFSVGAADTFAGYTQNTGKIAVISNFNTDGKSPIGKVDTLGTASKNPANWLDDVSTLDISYDSNRYLEGDASLKVHVAKTETFDAAVAKTIDFNRTTIHVRDISGVTIPADISNVYLCFYLYVEKKSAFANIAQNESNIELSNVVDSVEYGFHFGLITNQIKNDGWNKIQIPFSSAGKQGVNGAMSLKRVRMFIFSGGQQDVDVYFDNMTIETIGKPTGTTSSSSKPTITLPVVSNRDPATSSSANSSKESNQPDIPAASGSLNVKEESTVTSTEDIQSTVTDTSSISSTSSEQTEEGSSALLWIIIGAVALIVIGGAAAAVIIMMKNKKAKPTEEKSE